MYGWIIMNTNILNKEITHLCHDPNAASNGCREAVAGCVAMINRVDQERAQQFNKSALVLYPLFVFLDLHQLPSEDELQLDSATCRVWLQSWQADFSQLLLLVHEDGIAGSDHALELKVGKQLRAINTNLKEHLQHISQNAKLKAHCETSPEVHRAIIEAQETWHKSSELGVHVSNGVYLDPSSTTSWLYYHMNDKAGVIAMVVVAAWLARHKIALLVGGRASSVNDSQRRAHIRLNLDNL